MHSTRPVCIRYTFITVVVIEGVEKFILGLQNVLRPKTKIKIYELKLEINICLRNSKRII